MLHPHLAQYSELYYMMLKIDEIISDAGVRTEVVSDFQDLQFEAGNPSGNQNQIGYIHSAGVHKPIRLNWMIFYESDSEKQGALQICVELTFSDNTANAESRRLRLRYSNNSPGSWFWILSYEDISPEHDEDPPWLRKW